MKRAAIQLDNSPTCAVVNQATVDLGVDLDAMIAAINQATVQCFAPYYGFAGRLERAKKVANKAWNMLILDNADAPGALAYHDVTPAGYPILKVFAKTILADNASFSVAASHEWWETAADPYCQEWSDCPDGHEYAHENSDAVEETDFSINGIRISNFVTREWFYAKAIGRKYDYMGLLKKPFELLKGGYAIVRKAGKVSQIFADGPNGAKAKRFAQEDRRQHRSEYRRAA